MGCTYVKEFDFGPQKTYVKGYARGGRANVDAAQDRALVRSAVHRHEKALHPGEPQTRLARGGSPRAEKVGRVMGEFKAGELHSGSKSGPLVKSPKQAVAIALSEARRPGRK